MCCDLRLYKLCRVRPDAEIPLTRTSHCLDTILTVRGNDDKASSRGVACHPTSDRR
jgi:hypothetical protein